MKEQEYINVSDLAKIRSAISVLRTIIPTNSKAISKNEFTKISEIMHKWEERLSSKIVIK